MLNYKEESSLIRTESRLLTGEVAMCVLAVVLAIGLFALSDTEKGGPFALACDSIFVFSSMPPAVSAGRFSEQLCGNPPLESPIRFKAKETALHQPRVVMSVTTSLVTKKIEE